MVLKLEPDLMAIAVRPQEPIFFFEIDKKHSISLFTRIKNRLRDINNLYNLDSQIYKTKHGYHIIVQSTSWDQVIELREKFFSWVEVNYFNDDPTKAALRITAKWHQITGEEISPAPALLWESTKGLPDLRTSIEFQQVEFYATSD